MLYTSLLYAQGPLIDPYAASITREELKTHVYQLASETLEGRSTGSEGQKLAAAYIQEEFRKDGLTPPFRSTVDPYFQPFSLGECLWKKQSLAAGEIAFTPGKDFLFLTDPQNVSGTFPLVFAGFGIDDTAYSDYRGLEVQDKVVVAFSGEPKGKDGTYLLSGQKEPSRKSYYASKARTAAAKGAKGLIMVSQENKKYREYLKRSGDFLTRPDVTYPDTPLNDDPFVIYTGKKNGALLLNTSPRLLQQSIKETEAGQAVSSGRFTGTADIMASMECSGMSTENVIGMVLGTDLADEAVVVVAHYDHLGTNDGKIYFGADDNASGTAAVMEIAEAFVKAAQEGYQPRRTMIFLAVTAEEIGLFGSRYYSENPLVALDKTYACINIDMIGRAGTKMKETPDYIGGWAYLSPALFEITRENNAAWAPGLADRMEYRENARGGSDHYHFARNGIPSLFYFTGIHKDYHQPTDTPDKILYDRMEQIVRAIFGTAWELANTDRKLLGED